MKNIKDYLKQNLVKDSIVKCKLDHKNFNAFVEIYENQKCFNPKGKLANVPFAIKDNFDFKNHITTSGSKLLKDHFSPENATVVQRLIDEGAVVVGKSNLDEFGAGGTGLNSCYGAVKNNLDKSLIIGGSSSGSAVVVGTGAVPFAIGSDTGDSIRQPAAWNGTVGFKPTWGLISRYGLHAFAPSFDTVGFITNNVYDQALLTSITSGRDEKDFTCLDQEPVDLVKNLTSKIKGMKVAIFNESQQIFPKKYNDLFQKLIVKLKAQGVEVEEISFGSELLEVIYPTYQAISFAELASQLACLDGISFGNVPHDEKFFHGIAHSRTKLFGRMVKQRILIGSNATLLENQENVFRQAKKIRQLIINRAQDIFKKYDAYLALASKIPPKAKDSLISTNPSSKIDYFQQVANMYGGPSITLPFTKINNFPVSVEIAANIFEEQKVLNLALAVEKIAKKEINNGL